MNALTPLTDRNPTSRMKQHAGEASELLLAMGNERRLMILCNLVGRELSVSELLAQIELSQSALSQHLAVLRESGLVQTRRSAQTIFYSLSAGPARRVMQTLHDIYCGDSKRTASHKREST